jgi:signal transduction histidine kinase
VLDCLYDPELQMIVASTHKPTTYLVTWLIIFFGAYLSIQFILLTNVVSPEWPWNAIALAFIIHGRVPLGAFVVRMLFVSSAILLAELIARGINNVAFGLTLANFVEIVVAAVCLRAFRSSIVELPTFRDLLVFLVFAILIPSMLSATIAGATLWYAGVDSFESVWFTWFLADALCMAIFGPFALYVYREKWPSYLRDTKIHDVVVVTILTLAVAGLAIVHILFFLLLIPVILIATFRLGLIGTGIVTLFSVTVGSVILFAEADSSGLVSMNASQRIAVFQLFVAANVLWAFPLAGLLAENQRLLARVLADNLQLHDESTRKSALLLELHRNLINAEERERLRLAHELHDETAQSIAVGMMELKQLERLVQGEGVDRITQIKQLWSSIGKTLHDVAWQLRPSAIDGCGLAPSIEDYISQWNSRSGREVEFHCADSDIDNTPIEIRIVIYRFVQEALTNVSKHANASSVSVMIGRHDQMLEVSVEDDGSGFDAEAFDSSNKDGLGLLGMRERLALLCGEFLIESSPGRGTTVFARIPVPPHPA